MSIWKAKEGSFSSGKANRYWKRSRGILLNLLLADKSTKKNIIWATDTYEELGHGFADKEQIDENCFCSTPTSSSRESRNRRRSKPPEPVRKPRSSLRHGSAIS